MVRISAPDDLLPVFFPSGCIDSRMVGRCGRAASGAAGKYISIYGIFIAYIELYLHNDNIPFRFRRVC